jgi:hypothetical protein
MKEDLADLVLILGNLTGASAEQLGHSFGAGLSSR